jgi:hypothetical protein
MTSTTFLLDNHGSDTRHRFAALSALFDTGTARHLDELGVGPGWRCWEVGAGGPSVPRLLADRVGARGLVVATDVDLSHLRAAELPASVTVARHDVATDPPPAGGFDHEVAAHLAALAAGELDIATPPLVSAWGRRPGAPS